MWYVFNALLAMLAVSAVVSSSLNVTPECLEASSSFETCIEGEQSPTDCMDIYYDVLGKCYSQDVKDCALASLEYLGLGCSLEGQESNPSCLQAQANFESLCTKEALDLIASSAK